MTDLIVFACLRLLWKLCLAEDFQFTLLLSTVWSCGPCVFQIDMLQQKGFDRPYRWELLLWLHPALDCM
jgi:hypothetical protein